MIHEYWVGASPFFFDYLFALVIREKKSSSRLSKNVLFRQKSVRAYHWPSYMIYESSTKLAYNFWINIFTKQSVVAEPMTVMISLASKTSNFEVG